MKKYTTEQYKSGEKRFFRVKRFGIIIANSFGSRGQAYRYIELIKQKRFDKIGKMKVRL